MEFTREDLKQAIKDAREHLAELKEADALLDRLGNKISKSSSKTIDTSNTPILGETGDIIIDELELPPKAVRSGNSLAIAIKELVGRFGTQEFTVTHVDTALRNMGKGSDAKHFKNRVAMEVKKLFVDGTLERTHKGIGNDPHKYRLVTTVSLVKNVSND